MDIRLKVEKGSSSPREIRLRSEETIIGRRGGCDLRIPSAAVSRRHCRLYVHDDSLVVEDLDSANGTFVNGARVKDTQIINSGDRLEVGPITFRVKIAAAVPEVDVEVVVDDNDAKDIPVVPVVGADDEELVEVEAVEPPAVKKPGKGKKPNPAKKSAEPKAEAKTPPPKKIQERPKDDEPETIDFEDSLHLPDRENMRDLLSQMDDS
jgi:pSer/pThr/pTyr-binding forkhead associated (FHA) protein